MLQFLEKKLIELPAEFSQRYLSQAREQSLFRIVIEAVEVVVDLAAHGAGRVRGVDTFSKQIFLFHSLIHLRHEDLISRFGQLASARFSLLTEHQAAFAKVAKLFPHEHRVDINAPRQVFRRRPFVLREGQ